MQHTRDDSNRPMHFGNVLLGVVIDKGTDESALANSRRTHDSYDDGGRLIGGTINEGHVLLLLLELQPPSHPLCCIMNGTCGKSLHITSISTR